MESDPSSPPVETAKPPSGSKDADEPLHPLARNESCLEADFADQTIDAIVVGSGYGGAVAALRLAEAGKKVVVLERGEEWLSGEFPDGLGKAFGQVRWRVNNSAEVQGNPQGLFELRMGDGLMALVGNALGGTSQINANLLRRPDAEVFSRKFMHEDDRLLHLWPAALRDGNTLDAYYYRARQMLGAQRLGNVFRGSTLVDGGSVMRDWSEPAKHKALAQLYQALDDAGVPVTMAASEWITVNASEADAGLDANGKLSEGRCVACGDCVAGCNFNAKRALTHSYLPQAKAAGARLYTGSAVQWLEPDGSGSGWKVFYVPSSAERDHQRGVKVPVKEVSAKMVVLAAGTFGSTEILLRTREQNRSLKIPLRFSRHLGRRLSANGDNLAVQYLQDREVNGVGVGSAGMARDGQAVGPTITGCIRIDDAEVDKRFLVQDASVPRALSAIYQELLTTFGALPQLAKCRPMEPNARARKREPLNDWASLHPKSLTHSQLLLLVGHDRSGGHIDLDPQGCLAFKYDTEELAQIARHQMSVLRAGATKGGGLLLANPLYKLLPVQLGSAEKGGDRSVSGITVHPLGGCCMGDDVDTGVVNEFGQVFDASRADQPTSVHEGLYILDGSIIPSSLGANPLWTITALAERACEHLVSSTSSDVDHENAGRSPRRAACAFQASLGPPMRDEKTHAEALRHVPVRFTEVLRSSKFLFKRAFIARYGREADGRAGGEGDRYQPARLLLHMPLPSLEAFGADPQHTVVLASPNVLPGREAGSFRFDDERGQRLGEMTVVGGSLNLLPVPTYARWRRHVGALRVGLTYFQQNQWRGVGRYLLSKCVTLFGSRGGVPFWSLAHHMAEERVMRYHVQLREPVCNGHDARDYVLVGTKQVGYAASRGQIFKSKQLQRRNVWDSFMTLDAKLFEAGGKLVGEGALQMDLVDLMRYYAPQLGRRGNTPDALVTLTGYATWMLRLLAVTRCLDLWPRAVPRVQRNWRDPPNSPEIRPQDLQHHISTKPLWPVPNGLLESNPLPRYPDLQVINRKGKVRSVSAEGPYRFLVRRSRGTKTADVELFLVRYPSKKVRWTKNTSCGEGVYQTNAILLINGFAQSTLPFIPEEFDRTKGEIGLAAFYYELGMDVWMLEYRLSSVLEASKLHSTMDDIAEFDIPAAVDVVLERLMLDLMGDGPLPSGCLQVHAFAHCIGSGAMGMSLLGGYLTHPGKKRGDGQPVSKLASITFSQIHPYLVGGETAQMRLQAAALLQNLPGIQYLNLSPADQPQGSGAPSEALESVLDGFFASLPTGENELCPEERDGKPWCAAACTCKRVGGVISRVLKHDQIKPETHAKLAEYFGRANTAILSHGALCVEHERLVDSDGQNVYVTTDRLAKYLHMPVALLHGKQNPMFSAESAEITHSQLRAYVPAIPKTCHALIVAESFGHFDCTIGGYRSMRKEILRPLRAFYANVRRYAAGAAEKVTLPSKYVLQPPLSGPMLGWARRAPGRDGYLVRVWMAADDLRTTAAEFAMTVVEGEGGTPESLAWCMSRIPLPGSGISDDEDMQISVAVADVFIPDDALRSGDPIKVVMGSAHKVPINHLPGRTVPSSGGAEQMNAERRSQLTPPGSHHEGALDLVGVQPIPFEPEFDAGGFSLANLKYRMARPKTLRDFVAEFQDILMLAPTTPIPQGGGETAEQTRGWVPLTRLPPRFTLGLERLEGLDGSERSVLQIEPMENARIASQEARNGLIGLRRQQVEVREAALQANPSTLSRRLRNAYPLGGGEAGAAWVFPRVLADSSTNNLCFVAACCQHPGTLAEIERADASMLEIADGLEKGDIPAQFLCLLGDQIYADATAGLTDSVSPIERLRSATLRAFNAEGFRKVTSQLPTYMTLDDHEIDNDWSTDKLEFRQGHEAAEADAKRQRDVALAYFKAYQWMHSPRNGSVKDCFDYNFDAIESRFYALDTRSHRRRFGTPQVCAPEQIEALVAWLDSGHADMPHFITMGSVLAPGLHAYGFGPRQVVSHSAADNWQLAPTQRRQVLQAMGRCEVRNVVLVSGDYHCSAVSTLEFHDDKGKLVKTAYAVVTPPLYAPFPGINVHPKDVIEKEEIDLGDGWCVTIRTTAWSGQGYCVTRMERLAAGARVLDVSMHLTWLDSKNAPTRIVRRVRCPLT
ncbi:alkaline phosphatase D family protein [Ottowia sp.]|uniref:alkaline phosphatase D family protein n=1 Tax=Ottowia sp. TaxID=1898956 RepID=UPI00260E364B|nr:alkaline phosphatase D family protein [Ottowia sp.]